MADVEWIKIATDLFGDEKILLIEAMPNGDALIVIWLKLLTLAGKLNNSGVLMLGEGVPYTADMLATVFRRPPALVRQALETFEGFGMVRTVEGVITLPNWEKHQSEDKLEKMARQNRDRVRRHREKQRQIANATVTLHVMECNGADKDKDKDLESSGNRVDFLELLTHEEIEYLKTIYSDVYSLLDQAGEDATLKRKRIEKPLEYVIGYAEKKLWLRSQI